MATSGVRYLNLSPLIITKCEMEAERESMDSQGAVSFVVSFNESPKKQRKLPKGLAERRQQRLAKTLLTEESIAEKQRKAQERRKVVRTSTLTHTLTSRGLNMLYVVWLNMLYVVLL